ncbi:MAG: preprotein translocase subunit SecE [Thermodesulfobacteriota bacterium]
MAKQNKKPGDGANAAMAKLTKAVSGRKAAAKAVQGQSAASLWERTSQFMREVVQELKRVTWPSRRQTISSTGVVLALVILVSIFLGLVDFVLSRLVRFLIG